MLGGNIEVDGTPVASGFGPIFGFYLERGDTTFYSLDVLNPNGNPQAVIYQGDDSTQIQIGDLAQGTFLGNEFIVAFEDLVYAGSDKDFQDLVVIVESLLPETGDEPGPVPVPEPSTILTWIGIIGALGLMRFRSWI